MHLAGRSSLYIFHLTRLIYTLIISQGALIRQPGTTLPTLALKLTPLVFFLLKVIAEYLSHAFYLGFFRRFL